MGFAETTGSDVRVFRSRIRSFEWVSKTDFEDGTEK